jgi:two-component system, sensor histidine kinase and response regulator
MSFGNQRNHLAGPPLVTRHSLREGRHEVRILVADDNAVNRTLAVRLLERRGYSVTVAVNGKEAVNILRDHPHHLVLMDVHMPEMDGFEATAAIREREKTANIRLPIVAMTARAMKSDQESCLQKGMDAYISKPINSSELLKVVESFLPAPPVTETKAADRRVPASTSRE